MNKIFSAVINGDNIHRTVNYDLFMIHGGSSRANGANIILVGSECRIGNYAGYLQFEVNDPEHTNGYRVLKFTTQLGLTQTLKNGIEQNISDAAIIAKSISTHGYIKYASGLIIQWVSARLNSGYNENINFPITFPVGSKAAVCTPNIDNTSVAIYGLYNSYFQTYASKSCLCWHFFMGY